MQGSQGRVGRSVDWVKRPRSCGTEILLEVRAIAVALSAYCVRIFDLCVHLKVVWESGTSS